MKPQPRRDNSRGPAIRPVTWGPPTAPRTSRCATRRNRSADGPPPGRALHMVDVENLAGGPFTGLARVALAAYLKTSEWREGDHVLVAGHPRSALEAGLAIDVPCRLLPAHGPDGADLALLAAVQDVRFVAAHYERIVIGSGDGIFVDLVEELQSQGLEVWVVAPHDGLSLRLGAASRHVVKLATDVNRTSA